MVSEKLEAALRGKKSKKKRISVDVGDPLFLPASLVGGTPVGGGHSLGQGTDSKPSKRKESKKKQSGVSNSKVQSGTTPVVTKANKLRSMPVATTPATSKKPSKYVSHGGDDGGPG